MSIYRARLRNTSNALSPMDLYILAPNVSPQVSSKQIRLQVLPTAVSAGNRPAYCSGRLFIVSERPCWPYHQSHRRHLKQPSPLATVISVADSERFDHLSVTTRDLWRPVSSSCELDSMCTDVFSRRTARWI